MKDVQAGRPQRAAYPEPPVHAPNAALLIDFDNVTMGIRSDLQNQLRRLLASDILKGKVSVQRAYADWRRYPQYIVPLSEASIDLIFAPAFGSNKKNATDIRLAIDALELVFTRPEIGTFILLSGDSDFSSLVLKLKEYAKYVIGVGIRESSSDLLIQNCDEYYSYGELTGLTREGEVESVRRDPWELVVEAVLKMKEEDDVMRSDRLKQVMQAIDANFDEKEAGFNRFSKFVQECGRRGLLTLTKLDNGQYAIDVGLDANIPPGEASVPKTGATVDRERPKGRRRRPERQARPAAQEPLALAEAFELLKQSLWVLGAVGEESAAADRVRSTMIDLFGDDVDPVFDSTRFKRFLRQAHDAGLIDLVKSDDGYLLKLSTTMATADIAASEDAESRGEETAAVVTEGGDEDAGTAPHGRSAARKSAGPRGRGRAPRRGDSAQRSRKEPKKPALRPDPGSEVEPRSRDETTASGPDGGSAESKDTSRRNPRFRRGSRGTRPAAAEATAQPEPEPKPMPQPRSLTSSGPRSLGPRSGSRSLRPERPAETPDAGAALETADRSRSIGTEAGQVVGAGLEQPPTSAAPSAEAVLGGAPNEEESLLRRMTAALHRMVGGPTTKREDS